MTGQRVIVSELVIVVTITIGSARFLGHLALLAGIIVGIAVLCGKRL